MSSSGAGGWVLSRSSGGRKRFSASAGPTQFSRQGGDLQPPFGMPASSAGSLLLHIIAVDAAL